MAKNPFKNKKKSKAQSKAQSRSKRELGFSKAKRISGFDDSSFALQSNPKHVKEHNDEFQKRKRRTYNEEGTEVCVVPSEDSINDEIPKSKTFNQLSNFSMIKLINSNNSVMLGDENDLLVDTKEEEIGFFFDSNPGYVDLGTTEYIEEEKEDHSYKRKRDRIIQDDSVYIDKDDDDDDSISISSSEDVDMLSALAHWGKADIMSFDMLKSNTMFKEDLDDYRMLDNLIIDDICNLKDELEEDTADNNILIQDSLDIEQLTDVPESLKYSYQNLIRQQKNRVKKLASSSVKLSKSNKKSVLDEILQDFIKNPNTNSYQLENLSAHGRNVVVPSLVRLFQLETKKVDTRSSCNSTCLYKTDKTCIPVSFVDYVKQNEKKDQKKRKNVTNNSSSKLKKHEQENLHGKLVAAASEPISSSNIGHRMLSSMGWKQGDAIGGRDGIKEPVKAYMRAKLRGLGA